MALDSIQETWVKYCFKKNLFLFLRKQSVRSLKSSKPQRRFLPIFSTMNLFSVSFSVTGFISPYLINTHAYTSHITFSSKVSHRSYHPPILKTDTEHNPISCSPSIPSSLSLFPFPSFSTPPCHISLSQSRVSFSPSASSTICSLLPFLLDG